MDRFRGAICLAMSISVSMGVTGSEQVFLEIYRLTCKGGCRGDPQGADQPAPSATAMW